MLWIFVFLIARIHDIKASDDTTQILKDGIFHVCEKSKHNATQKQVTLFESLLIETGFSLPQPSEITLEKIELPLDVTQRAIQLQGLFSGTLTSLNLRKNHFSDASLLILKNALQGNSTVTEIEL